MIFRYITQHNLRLYQRNGWDCRFLYVRGENLHCFMCSFRCCDA